MVHGSAEFDTKSDAENVEMMESDGQVEIGFSDPPEPGNVGDEVSGENAQDGGDELGVAGKRSDDGEDEGKKVKKRAKSRVGDEATAPVEGKRRKNGKVTAVQFLFRLLKFCFFCNNDSVCFNLFFFFFLISGANCLYQGRKAYLDMMHAESQRLLRGKSPAD